VQSLYEDVPEILTEVSVAAVAETFKLAKIPGSSRQPYDA